MANKKALTKKQIDFLNKHTLISWTFNPETGLVDVVGHFVCFGVGIRSLQKINFGNVSGDFICSDNKLTSLEGAPQSVRRDFDCGFNKLTSLEGAPKSVGRNFCCRNNELTSLEGVPEDCVKIDFENNPIEETIKKELQEKGKTQSGNIFFINL